MTDLWLLFKEFLDPKLQDDAAERYVDMLSDHGVTDKALSLALGYDEILDGAISYYLDESEDESFTEEEPDYDDE